MSFCTNCGSALTDTQRFCVVCGHQVATSSHLPAAPPLNPGEWRATIGQPARVLVGLAHAAPRQSRWSVLLRAIISIPLVLWLVVISFAAGFVVIGSWFAALLTGRVPDKMQRFMTDALRYEAKVTAYLGLLIDRWPGLWLRARPGDQISLEVDHVGLNRAAVLFRCVLVVPALLVSSAVTVGSYFLTIAMWACAIVRGRVPQALHEARGQAWRFTVRSSAYIELLTPTQPFSGFFGQPSPTGDPADSSLATTGSLSPWGRIVFVVTLAVGAYFQVQPGLTQWPASYAFDRTFGPTVVAALNQNIVDDLANFTSTSTACTRNALGGCPVDAATAQVDIAQRLKLLQNIEPFVVEGRHEFLAYVHQVLVIDLTLEQAANAPSTQHDSYAAQVRDEANILAALFTVAHRAI